MAYITKLDIEEIYGANFLLQLLPVEENTDLYIEKAIFFASGEVDIYLSQRFEVPLTSVSSGIKIAVIDLACYRLAVTHDRLTDEISKRASDAREMLKVIASGKAGIGIPPSSTGVGNGETTGSSSLNGAYFGSKTRLFSRGTRNMGR